MRQKQIDIDKSVMIKIEYRWVDHISSYLRKFKYLAEIITLLLYAGALIFVLYYHEPWFDEAQAWLIARDATMMELLGSITHYEGHPPIWFLLLMPFAKLGVPFELGVKAVNFILVTGAMGLVIFKAPFHRLIRCTIPFTYFFFYQHGVISRTYSLMMFGFIVSALFYKERNEKPFRFIAALSVICGASAYGILLAAGITIAWLWEVLEKPLSWSKIKLFLKSKVFYAMLILLLYNILLMLSIYPFPDTFAISTYEKQPIAVVLFYMFFVAPASALCTMDPYDATMDIKIFLMFIFISIIINLLLYLLAKKAKMHLFFMVPYLLFAVFASTVYFSTHHIGILTMFYLFLLWCFFQKSNMFNQKWLHYGACTLIPIVIGISIYWSVIASVNDVLLNYGTGREAAKFITENKLDEKNILVAWRQTLDEETGEKYDDYNSLQGIPTLAYFDTNIFYNFNHQLNHKCYLLHKINKDSSTIHGLIKNSYPEVLLKTDHPGFIFGSEINMEDFALVKSVHGNNIWKDITIEDRQFIYIRKDLLKNYPNLHELNMEEEKVILPNPTK